MGFRNLYYKARIAIKDHKIKKTIKTLDRLRTLGEKEFIPNFSEYFVAPVVMDLHVLRWNKRLLEDKLK